MITIISAIDSFKKLDILVKEKEISFYYLSKQVEFPSSFFSEWKRGKMMPKVDKLSILAEHLGVPVNYFLEEVKEDT